MFTPIYINGELVKERRKFVSEEYILVQEAKKILIEQQFSEKNILQHLKSYNKSFGLLNEDGLDKNRIFTINEIRNICIRYRLRFVDSDVYKGEFPYESILKIKDLNDMQRKDLKFFKVISSTDNLKDASFGASTLLFSETMLGNYYLIHEWGEGYPAKRRWKYRPLMTIEAMMATLIALSLLITLVLPNKLITTDTRAEYFSMYRVACFFHVLILNMGFTVFYLFGRNITFSSSNWDSKKL